MKKKKTLFFCSLTLVLWGLGAMGGAQEPSSTIDPEADGILRQMSDYLNTLEQFTVQTENTVDILFLSGQKIQYDRVVHVSVRRPNRLHATIDGDRLDQEFFYNGSSITLFTKNPNVYASIKAPSSVEEALESAETSVGLVAPFSDLICRNSYDILMKDVWAGFYIGLGKVNGVECHHLAFRGSETDWQVWIEKGDKPLPRKFIITSKWVTGAPQFTGLMRKWDLSPKLDESLFTFVPPKGAAKIEFLPSED